MLAATSLRLVQERRPKRLKLTKARLLAEAVDDERNGLLGRKAAARQVQKPQRPWSTCDRRLLQLRGTLSDFLRPVRSSEILLLRDSRGRGLELEQLELRGKGEAQLRSECCGCEQQIEEERMRNRHKTTIQNISAHTHTRTHTHPPVPHARPDYFHRQPQCTEKWRPAHRFHHAATLSCHYAELARPRPCFQSAKSRTERSSCEAHIILRGLRQLLKGHRADFDVLPALAFPRKATRPRYLREVCDIHGTNVQGLEQHQEENQRNRPCTKSYTRSRVFGVSCGNSLRDDLRPGSNTWMQQNARTSPRQPCVLSEVDHLGASVSLPQDWTAMLAEWLNSRLTNVCKFSTAGTVQRVKQTAVKASCSASTVWVGATGPMCAFACLRACRTLKQVEGLHSP